MKRRYDIYLKDIIDSIERIESYTESLDEEDLEDNQMVVDAVLRNFQVIGEAVAEIPDRIKEEHDTVPWRDVKDFRNVVVHKYWAIDIEIAWEIIQNRLPELKTNIQTIIDSEDFE